MARFRAGPCSIGVGVALLVSATLVSTGQQPGLADVTAVRGSAFGYTSVVSLFGGPSNTRPCANPATNEDCRPRPSVTLPAGGSPTPISDSVQTGDARYGPGIIFTSGPITVSTQGTLGTGGTVVSTATIQTVNTSQMEVFTAASISSTCTASEAGPPSGSTTVTGGVLILQDPDPGTTGEEGEEVVQIPTDPAPNTRYAGTVANVNDNFEYIFNEQIENPDGSITVNAAHQRLLGPTAVGDLFIGQSVCGVTATGTPTTTVDPNTTTTTTVPATTTTDPSTTTTTTDPSTTTTTTVPATTTTTRAGTAAVLGTTGTRGTTGTPAAGGALARTGGRAGWMLALGLGFFGVGMAATLAGRRRRPTPSA